MNKTKDIQKKRIIYIGETVFCLLIAILWLVSLSQDILNKVDWADALKDFIWLIIFGIATWYNFYQAKTIGTTKFEDDVDDERDQYIEMKTNKLMFNISLNLLMILGALLLICGMVWGKTAGLADIRVIILVTTGVAFLLLWTLLIITWFIVLAINYRKN